MATSWRETGRPLRDTLKRRSIAEICALVEPGERELEGLLYETIPPPVRRDAAAEAREARWRGMEVDEYVAWRAAQRSPPELMVSGAPLASEAPTPFVLDGRRYHSVWCFYQSLKLPETDPARALMAAGEYPRRRGPPRFGRTTLHYRGEEIAVNSAAHGALIARATEAKVLAHAHVREALAATGTSRLYMGYSSALVFGRYMPFALMVLRFRLGPRS